MGKYGKAAIRARDLLKAEGLLDPPAAWNKAVSEVFPDSPSSQEKGCPRGVFLGLCSDGWICGVPSGPYTRSKDNRRYAVEAVKVLSLKPSLVDLPDQLWAEVMQGEEKVENSQMDVVISLWKAGAIEKPNV